MADDGADLMTLATGTLLAGRYEITSPIATGGMGEVWRARDRVLDRVVAAKVLRSEFTGDPNFLARFRNEGRHTAGLSHPNIASVYDYGETDDESRPGQRLAFLLMELVEGEPLVTVLHDEGRLSVDATLQVLAQAADGLSAAHDAGVVHRDIKPGNLIVRPDGVVKLTDFGIARARDAIPLTRTGMVVGTAQYLSPEQAQGFEVTASSDVYSLGVVGYECLTGVRPFDGTSQVAIALAHINKLPPPLPDRIPLAVRQLLECALAKDPDERFDDGAAFAAAIRAVAAAVGSVPAVLPPPLATGTQATLMVGNRVTDDPGEFFAPHPGGEPVTTVLDTAETGAVPVVSAPRSMPPLQAPPSEDDWDDDAGGPPRARWLDRRWLWAAAALLVLALLVVGYVVLQRGDGGGGTSDPTTSSSPTTASGSAAFPTATGLLLFDVASVLGHDVVEAQQALTALGFTAVVPVAATDAQVASYASDLDVRAVAATDPEQSGQLAADAPITLFYVPEPTSPGSAGTSSQTARPTGGSTPTAATPTAGGATAIPTVGPTTAPSPQLTTQAPVPPTTAAGTTPPPEPSTVAPTTPAEPSAPAATESAAG